MQEAVFICTYFKRNIRIIKNTVQLKAHWTLLFHKVLTTQFLYLILIYIPLYKKVNRKTEKSRNLVRFF